MALVGCDRFLPVGAQIVVLQSAGGVEISILRGRTALVPLERPVKGGQAGKPGLDGDVRHGELRHEKHLLRGANSLFRQVLVKGVIGVFLKEPREIEL